MSIETRTIEYSRGATVFEGFFAWDNSAAGPRPGVMVAHAWRGRSDSEDQKAIALAQLGYTGFALDLYGKGVRGRDKEENAALMQPLLDDREMLQQQMLLALHTLREQPEVDQTRVAAIGFCFGGLCVLDLARTGENLAGVVSFHGLLGKPDNTAANRIHASVLVLHGWDDPLAPHDKVIAVADELTAQQADWQLVGYGHAMHAFSNPEANDPGFGTVYNAAADRRSWQAMQNFLVEIFDAEHNEE